MGVKIDLRRWTECWLQLRPRCRQWSHVPALCKSVSWTLFRRQLHVPRKPCANMCHGQLQSELLTCQQLASLPGNIIHSDTVRQAVHHCVRYLTTNDDSEPLEVNHLMDLRKQGIFASSDFVVDVDNDVVETIQAAKALAVTLATATESRGRVQITVLDPAEHDMDAIKALGFGLGSASWAYTWLTPDTHLRGCRRRAH